MSSVALDRAIEPEVQAVTWLADSLAHRAAAEQWQQHDWATAQSVLECLVSETTTEVAPRPTFALYALALCKDITCA